MEMEFSWTGRKKLWYAMAAPRRSAAGEIVSQVRVDVNSPWFVGHFPDFPVLPGIAQLKMVVDMLAESLGKDLHILSVSRVKFKKLVVPDETLKVRAQEGERPLQYSFRITSGEEDVSTGTIFLNCKEHVDMMQTESSPTTSRVAEIIINELKLEDVTPATFDPDLDLVDEVGIDSMDLATIALVIRDEFGIRIDEDDYPKLTTLRIIANYIDDKKSEQE